MLIVMPMMVYYLRDYFFIFAMDEDTDVYLSRKLLSYSEREIGSGIANRIISTFRYASLYAPLFFCYKSLIRNRKKDEVQTNHSELLLFKVSFGLAYVSAIFLFMGDTFITFFYRILFMTIIPNALLLSKLYIDKRISNRAFLFCIIVGMSSQVVHYLYMIYVS